MAGGANRKGMGAKTSFGIISETLPVPKNDNNPARITTIDLKTTISLFNRVLSKIWYKNNYSSETPIRKTKPRDCLDVTTL